jgi:hypothetical protein
MVDVAVPSRHDRAAHRLVAALTLSYRIMRFNRRVDLVEQDMSQAMTRPTHDPTAGRRNAAAADMPCRVRECPEAVRQRH